MFSWLRLIGVLFLIFLEGDFVPIVSVSAIPPTNLKVIPEMMEQIRAKGSLALKTPLDNVWVVFNPLPYYVQGDPAEIPPPIVVVKMQSGRGVSERTAFFASIAAEVGRGLSLPPERVWIQYQEMNPKDVWFNGKWSG
jgi:hypothetical protein